MVTSASCTGCLPTKNMVQRVVAEMQLSFPQAQLRFSSVDITDDPRVAVKYQILSTPAIVINGEVAMTGHVKEKKFRKALKRIIDT